MSGRCTKCQTVQALQLRSEDSQDIWWHSESIKRAQACPRLCLGGVSRGLQCYSLPRRAVLRARTRRVAPRKAGASRYCMTSTRSLVVRDRREYERQLSVSCSTTVIVCMHACTCSYLVGASSTREERAEQHHPLFPPRPRARREGTEGDRAAAGRTQQSSTLSSQHHHHHLHHVPYIHIVLAYRIASHG